MRVKAVDHGKVARVFGRLRRQVGRAAAAEHHDIDFLFPVERLGERHNRDLLRVNLHGLRIAPRKDSDELEILALLDCALNASSQVAVAQNTDACLHSVLLSERERCR